MDCNGSEFFTVAEVAARLRVSKMTVYRLVEAGTLTSCLVGRRSIRIPVAAVIDYIEKVKTTAGAS